MGNSIMASKTITLSIQASAQKVYDFASNMENFPLWAKTFYKSIQKSGEDWWVIETLQGPIKIKIAPKNHLGILDHTVMPALGVEIFVPMRLVPNGNGCEIIFTLFQQPGMTEEQFHNDQKMVEQDLAILKQFVEGEC